MAKQLSYYFISLVRDACLKVFWRKKTLAAFLRQYHINESLISPLFHEQTKAEVLSEIFARFSYNQTEEKQETVLAIAKDLSEMISFPDLEKWEDSDAKICEAKKAVCLLRQQYEKLIISFIDTGDAETRRQSKEKREICMSFEAQFQSFSERLIRIASMAGQQKAGYEFENWIYEFSVFNDIETRKPYKGIDGRQIDGALTFNGDTMLVEAKCTANLVGVTDIDSFRAKLGTKADNTLGLMISMAGYEKGAIMAASQGRTPFILLEGSHLFNLVMTRRLTFKEVIERIKRHAAQTGSPYLALHEF